MADILLPILIAMIVSLLAMSAWSIVQALLDPERRKLHQRLSTEGRIDGSAHLPRSITLQMDHDRLSAFLLQWEFFQKLFRKILQAWPTLSLSRFVLIAAGSSFFMFIIATAVSMSLLVGFSAAAVAAYLPFVILSGKRNARQRALSLQLPDALDFLSRILKAGHSLSTGLQMMSEELPRPLGDEFRRAYDQHSLGLTMDEALKDMMTRIESTDFAFFVTAVLIQRQTGGDLSEVLNNISGMIRQRIRLQQHVKAKTAEGRFTGYILSAFPVLMFVIASMLNPTYSSVLWKTNQGLMMLGTAFGLTVMGLFFIKKITTLKV